MLFHLYLYCKMLSGPLLCQFLNILTKSIITIPATSTHFLKGKENGLISFLTIPLRGKVLQCPTNYKLRNSGSSRSRGPENNELALGS